jgi:hypothetical protein
VGWKSGGGVGGLGELTPMGSGRKAVGRAQRRRGSGLGFPAEKLIYPYLSRLHVEYPKA